MSYSCTVGCHSKKDTLNDINNIKNSDRLSLDLTR